jgi:predicted O-methyltransferase YrrM
MARQKGITRILFRAFVRNLLGRDDYREQYEFFRKWSYSANAVPPLPSPRGPVESQALSYADINEHLTTLYLLPVDMHLKNVLELGTRDGLSTLAFLEAAKTIGGKVVSVDIDPCEAAKASVKKAGLEPYWTFMLGNDLEIPWSTQVDHLFIDTAHTYEQTVAELRRFEPFVRPGGIITLHDSISFEGVRRAIDEHIAGRSDLRGYRYFNNRGLDVIVKKPKKQ